MKKASEIFMDLSKKCAEKENEKQKKKDAKKNRPKKKLQISVKFVDVVDDKKDQKEKEQ